MVSSDKGTSYRTVDPKPYSWTGSSGEYRADSVATIQQQWLDCLLNNLIPDGKCALATKFTSNKVCLLDIDEMKATCMGLDLPVAINPCNADIAPDAKPAIVGNTGGRGRSNGNPDSVTIIDVEDDLTRLIDHVAGGNRLEGIVISPTGEIALTGNLNGSDAPPDAFFYSLHGSIPVLDIEGKEVTRLQEITLGPITEALVFSPDGK